MGSSNGPSLKRKASDAGSVSPAKKPKVEGAGLPKPEARSNKRKRDDGATEAPEKKARVDGACSLMKPEPETIKMKGGAESVSSEVVKVDGASSLMKPDQPLMKPDQPATVEKLGARDEPETKRRGKGRGKKQPIRKLKSKLKRALKPEAKPEGKPGSKRESKQEGERGSSTVEPKAPSVEGDSSEAKRSSPKGLTNHNVNCFFNAGLQLLASCSSFARRLVNEYNDHGLGNPELTAALGEAPKGASTSKRAWRACKSKVVEALANVRPDEIKMSTVAGKTFAEMWSSEKGASVSPMGLMLAFSHIEGDDFDGDTQQDAAEILDRLLSRILSAESKDGANSSGDASRKDGSFHGIWQQTDKCKGCGKEVDSQESFQMLYPTLPEGKEQAFTLGQCLAQLMEQTVEKKCEGCQHGKAVRSLDWSLVPDQLLMVIPRSYWDKEKGVPRKNNAMVEAPMKLNLKGVQEGHELRAVLVHRGRRSNEGHWIAYAKHNDQWFLFDDAKVKPVDADKVAGENPSILVYEAC